MKTKLAPWIAAMTDAPVRLEIEAVAAAEDPGFESAHLGVFDVPVHIGRASTCDLTLQHPTVSTEHAIVDAGGGGLSVTNVSTRGSTFVDRIAVPAGESAAVDADRAYVQIGQFLLLVQRSAATVPHPDPLPLPRTAEPSVSPLLTMELDVRKGRVSLAAVEMPLPRKPLLMLAALARSAGAPVGRDDLIDAVAPDSGWLNLDPLAHRLRRAIDAHCTLHPEVAEALESELAPSSEPGSFGRRLVSTVRGVGYQLALPRSLVRVIEPTDR